METLLYAQFDRSKWPLVTINFTGEKENESTFKVYLEELEANYQKQEDIALIFELSQAPIPKLSYQLKQAKWMKQNEKTISTFCKGVAYVIPSKVMRGVLQFIFSVQKNPAPFSVFSNYEEARTWAQSKLS